jgi:hypothetical protein
LFDLRLSDADRRNRSIPRSNPMASGPKPTQKEKFIDKARELGCDEDEAVFEKRLRKIAKATPPPHKDTKREKKKAPA